MITSSHAPPGNTPGNIPGSDIYKILVWLEQKMVSFIPLPNKPHPIKVHRVCTFPDRSLDHQGCELIWKLAEYEMAWEGALFWTSLSESWRCAPPKIPWWNLAFNWGGGGLVVGHKGNAWGDALKDACMHMLGVHICIWETGSELMHMGGGCEIIHQKFQIQGHSNIRNPFPMRRRCTDLLGQSNNGPSGPPSGSPKWPLIDWACPPWWWMGRRGSPGALFI